MNGGAGMRAGMRAWIRAGVRAASRALVLAAVAVASTACELTTIEVAAPEDVLVVEGYMRTDVASQEVFLYRTIPGVEGSLGVDGAEVRVWNEAGLELPFGPATGTEACARITVFEGEGGSCYRSALSAAFVEPGGTYRLEVAVPDGRRVTGRTTVPGAFRVVRPAARSCVLGSTSYELAWTRSAGAWSYQVVAELSGLEPGLRERGVENPPDEVDLTGIAVTSADTTITFPGEFGVFDRFMLDRDLLLALQAGLPSGARADIVLAAADRNFVNWVRGGTFNPSGQVRVPSVGGDGTGVFGSLVVHRRSLLAEDDGSGLPGCQ